MTGGEWSLAAGAASHGRNARAPGLAQCFRVGSRPIQPAGRGMRACRDRIYDVYILSRLPVCTPPSIVCIYSKYRREDPALHALMIRIKAGVAAEPVSQKREIANFLNYLWRCVMAIASELLIPWLELLIPKTCSDLIPFVGNAIRGNTATTNKTQQRLIDALRYLGRENAVKKGTPTRRARRGK
jgi:hypothetical protein